MRIEAVVIASLFIATPIEAVDIDLDSRAVIRLAIETAVSGALTNWEIADPNARFVLADRTISCSLPRSEAETLRVKRAYERLASGQDVPESELEARLPNPDEDLVLSGGRVISRELVRRGIRTQPELTLMPTELPNQVRVDLESTRLIDSTFRLDRERWENLHAGSYGVIRVSTPIFASDRKSALVSFSRLRNGFGGGSFTCYLVKSGDLWRVVWQEGLFIE